MHQCSVIRCKNVGHHSFPKETRIRKLWEVAIRRKAKKTSKICAAHFKTEDFIEVGRFTGLYNTRRILKKGIVPSIFQWTKPKDIISQQRRERAEARGVKREFDDDLAPFPNDTTATCNASSEMTGLGGGVDHVEEVVTQENSLNNPQLQNDIPGFSESATQKNYQFYTIESFRNDDKVCFKEAPEWNQETACKELASEYVRVKREPDYTQLPVAAMKPVCVKEEPSPEASTHTSGDELKPVCVKKESLQASEVTSTSHNHGFKYEVKLEPRGQEMPASVDVCIKQEPESVMPARVPQQPVSVKQEPPWVETAGGEETRAHEFTHEILLEPKREPVEANDDPPRSSPAPAPCPAPPRQTLPTPQQTPRTTAPARRTAQSHIFVCDACGKFYKRKQHLVRHIKSCCQTKPERTTKTYSCQTCHKRFRKLDNLKSHTRSHTGEKPYGCEICKKDFAHSSHLKNHKRIHSGEKPHSCEYCKKEFGTLSNLKRHIRTHTGEKPYACDVCNRRFSQTGDLKKHLRTHTGEKPYCCEVCPKKFADSGQLKSHKLIHTGEKSPFTCKICHKEFLHAYSLRIHIRSHTGEKHPCDVCKVEFDVYSHLKHHKRSHKGANANTCDVDTQSSSR